MSLDPKVGAMTPGADITRLGAIGHGAEPRGLHGMARDVVALMWPDLSATFRHVYLIVSQIFIRPCHGKNSRMSKTLSHGKLGFRVKLRARHHGSWRGAWRRASTT